MNRKLQDEKREKYRIVETEAGQYGVQKSYNSFDFDYQPMISNHFMMYPMITCKVVWFFLEPRFKTIDKAIEFLEKNVMDDLNNEVKAVCTSEDRNHEDN